MKILPSAVPHWERGLGLDCENSTINLMFRAVAPKKDKKNKIK